MSWPWLPVEILTRIFEQLKPSRDSDESVVALVGCFRSSSTLKEAALSSKLWEAHYLCRYTHSDNRAEQSRRASVGGNWQKMYALRRTMDRRALQMLFDIAQHSGGTTLRHAHALELVQKLSFDVWDALQIEAIRPSLSWTNAKGVEDTEASPVGLTWTFWANAMLGAITRNYTIRLWGTLREDSPLPSISFEHAFTGMSAFFGKSMHEITGVLDGFASTYHQTRHQEGQQSECDLLHLCTQLCEHLRDQGFGHAEGAHFHDLFNHFPHFFLKLPHMKTLPISLVYVFVAVAQRIGMEASPINYPGRVLARVSLANSPDCVFVDVFGSLSTQNPLRLRTVDIESTSDLGRAAHAAPMLIRATHNIAASLQLVDQAMMNALKPAEFASAIYAMRVARWLLSDPAVDPDRLLGLIGQYYPLDLVAVANDALCPLLGPSSSATLTKEIEDTVKVQEETDRIRNLRSTCGAELNFFVGQTFTHAKYSYRAIILSWDSTCTASMEWIAQMKVDSLPRGRNQPFYQVASATGGHHYVAEENIVPTMLTQKLIEDILDSFPNLGMFFSHAEFGSERGRMVLSPERRSTYPEDDAVGAAWVKMAPAQN